MDAADFLHGSCVLALMLSLIDIAQSVPPDYCLGNFNRSDCGGPPTRIAYYYKPGSRCEIATWRGCPTSNKFRDEVICSHICIARLFKDSAENMILSHSPSLSSENTTEIEELIEPVEVDDYEEWKHEMEAIEPDEVELMEELLDDIMEEHGRPEIKKLKHASKTTTASTVELTTETVADVSPADDPATPTTTSSTQMVDSTTAEPTTVDSTTAESTTVDSTTAEPTTVATTSITTTQNIDPGSADEVILT